MVHPALRPLLVPVEKILEAAVSGLIEASYVVEDRTTKRNMRLRDKKSLRPQLGQLGKA